MQVILNQIIELKDFRKGSARITKTFESDIIPHKGDIIVDTVWKHDDEQIVQSIEINYQENECYVYLPKISLPTDDKSKLEEYIEMTKLHNWECPFYV